MKVMDLLAMLRSRDIDVWADGDRLRCAAPAGRLTPELRQALRECKHEILQFLRSAGSLARQQRAIVPLQPRGSQVPVFAFGGHNGDVFCYRALAQRLGQDQPFFGLQPPGLDGHQEPLARVEDLAAYFAGQIREFHPRGPYIVAGFCAGGSIAFELARQLLRDGADLRFLALFGAPYPTAYRRLAQWRKGVAAQLERLTGNARAMASLPPTRWLPYVADKLRQRRNAPAGKRSNVLDPVLAQRALVERATFAALRHYVPTRFGGSLCVFLPCKEWMRSHDQPLRWVSLASRFETYVGPDGCTTDIMLREPHAAKFAELFQHATQRKPTGSNIIALRQSMAAPQLLNGGQATALPL